MEGIWFQLALVTLLILLNAVFAGAELALVSLREGQLQRLDARGGAGAVLAGLARDPNRFLATIQIVITLSGFFASASAAVTLSQPVSDSLAFLGGAARPVAVVLVTLAISYVTLVVGELAPKRLAMQRAEGWGLMIARPLSFLSTLTRPAVWLLSVSADLVVRVLGGDPTRRTEEVTREELRDLAASLSVLSSDHRLIISGALDISERTLREIVRPRREVVVLDETTPADTAVHILREAGYSRAPVAAGGDLDQAHGVVHLRDLVDRDVPVGDLAEEPLVLPETVEALEALRQMRQRRQHMAIVINEHGASEGIVTIEDLLEELVGEIYDESDRDVLQVVRMPSGALDVPGAFPIHDLEDIGVELPPGDYTTVAGLVLDALGHIPDRPGETVVVGDWEATVLDVAERAITRVRLTRHQE